MTALLQASVFADKRSAVYDHCHNATIVVTTLAGGIPSDPRVIEAWLRTKLGETSGSQFQDAVAEAVMERGLSKEEAVEETVATAKLNGFKRDDTGLYFEGRQVKACIKEAANICWPKRSWGPSRKGTRSFWAEHVFVVEDRLPLGITEATGINQRFVHTWRGSGIQNEEYVDDAKISFTVESDTDAISEDDWAELWVTAESNGIGATRSQGFGRFVVTTWDRVR